MKLFSLTRTEHVDCAACEAQGTKAAIIARVVGSSIGMSREGDHAARVERVSKAA